MNNKIATYSTLNDLVENDTKDHKLKNIAILFLNAMNDWPTSNQKGIADFINELKSCFGTPLTVEKIYEKKFNGNNAWQIEAGSSISELINLSAQFYSQPDFDSIIERMLKYYIPHRYTDN